MTEQALIEQLINSFADCDAPIVSDYGYGILTERVIAAIASLQHERSRVLAIDSKNLSAYRSLNITAVKPNYKQAIQLLGLEAAPTREEDTPINLIRLICPDIYVKGGDYTKQTLPEALIVEELGGVVKILPFVENRSTISIIQRICQQSGG